VRLLLGFLVIALWVPVAAAQTPLAGHYPPGQSGIRGAASPAEPGWAYTNFSRAFSNLEVKDADGGTVQSKSETRFANISMFTWNSAWKVLGMRYGALCGIPFATGNLNPSGGEVTSTGFGLGDILVTPVSLYGRPPSFDYQFQFTYWSSSGHFEPGDTKNRGSGFSALVYSMGGVWYPKGERRNWSASAVARFEQNFEQTKTSIHPGDDMVVDWGIGKVIRSSARPLELGVSGFGTWQLSQQTGGPTGVDTKKYHYLGAGPEGSYSPWDHWTLRLRAQWEFATHNAVQGNNLWFIVNFAS